MKSVQAWLIVVAYASVLGGIVPLTHAQNLPIPQAGFDVCVKDALSKWEAESAVCEAIPETDEAHNQCETAAAEELDADYEACLETFIPALSR